MSKKLISISSMAALLVLLTLSFTTMAQQRRNFQSQSANTRAAAQTDATSVFRSARDLITDGEWARAQAKFSEYVSSYPNEKNLDAALYWLAYAEHKLAKFDDARKTIDRLLEKFPNSNWRDDARVLLAQIPGAYATNYDEVLTMVRPGNAPVTIRRTEPDVFYGQVAPGAIPIRPVRGQGLGVGVGGAPVAWSVDEFGQPGNEDDPCEFKIVVLQALFQTDVQRGTVAASEWLKPGSTQTVRCKSAALTLLGRHGGKAVTPVILGLARSETDVKLRARAISTLGASNDDSVIDPLREFALNSTDNTIVEASLYALSRHTNERVVGVLADIATSGKTTAQRKIAIASIAGRAGEPAVDALFRIYDADQSVEIRKAVIVGFANRRSERAGEKLFEIARTSDNIELRKAAISNIPRRGGDKAIDFLISLYDAEKNEELKDQILNSFSAGATLVSPRALTGTGDTYVSSIGQNVYTMRTPVTEKKVIRKLIDIAKDPREAMARRKRAIGWLSRSNDSDVQRFLEALLRQ